MIHPAKRPFHGLHSLLPLLVTFCLFVPAESRASCIIPLPGCETTTVGTGPGGFNDAVALYNSLGGAAFFGSGLDWTMWKPTPDNVGAFAWLPSASIYWSPATGAREIHGLIRDRWSALGWEAGVLGYPTTNELSTPDGAGRYNHFERGSIYWTPSTGAHDVRGPIRDLWAFLGWERSPAGYPTTDELGTPDGIGRYNHFVYGSIYWTPQTGAHMVRGEIRDRWGALGWETGFLGYPITDENTSPDGTGKFNHFQGGSIYWSPGSGAHEVHGSIRDRWGALGWETGPLGYPTTDETGTPDGVGRFNHFTRGSIYWTPSTGAHAVFRPIRDRWEALGWENGPLGYPVAEEEAVPDGIGRVARFQKGSIYSSPATGAFYVANAIRDHWASLGYGKSCLGYPVGDSKEEMRTVLGEKMFTTTQSFEHGTVTVSSGGLMVSGAKDVRHTCPDTTPPVVPGQLTVESVDGVAGQVATVAVTANAELKSLAGFRLSVTFDPALGLGREDVAKGPMLDATALEIVNADTPGTVDIAVASGKNAPGPGTLLQLNFHVPPTAKTGASYPIKVTGEAVDETGQTVTVAFRDGAIRVREAPAVAGDLNGDGKAGIADVVLALRAAIGLSQPTALQRLAGDLDGDGRISLQDVIRLLRMAVGKG